MAKGVNRSWLAAGAAFVAACAICVVPTAGLLIGAGALVTAGGGLFGSIAVAALGLGLALGGLVFVVRGRLAKHAISLDAERP